MNSFCTIINKNYIPFANVLYKSLAKTDASVKLQVLIADLVEADHLPAQTEGIYYHHPKEVIASPIGKKIYEKYSSTQDQLRWALKPVFLRYLLENFNKLIYVDPDVWFTGPHGFLMDELDKYDILLSPHWSTIDPLEDEDGLYSILRNGLYSACFIGVNKKGVDALNWWAEVCHYKMEKLRELGLYDDQKYLDVLRLVNENTGLILHRGCNLTNINIKSSKRTMVNGNVMINDSFPAIFIHFTRDTIVNIKNGNDRLLQPSLKEYTREIEQAGGDPTQAGEISGKFLYSIKRKTRLRTRLKRWLFKLAEKL